METQHKIDCASETGAIRADKEGIRLAVEVGDNGTRELLDSILKDEEAHIDWLKAQLDQINQMAIRGRGPWYLARAKALSMGLSNAYFKSLGLPSLISVRGPGCANQPYRDAGSDPRQFRRRTEIPDGARGIVRRPRIASGDHRGLRRDLLFRRPADA